METFADSGLKPEIIRAVTDMGFEKPTPIQAKSIPQVISSRQDLVALAQTGTGKTAAFSLPVLHQINPDDKDVQAFILSPTRELALQIANDIANFTKYMDGVRVIPVYGGAKIEGQIKQLRAGGQIVVGTPGRVCDLIRRKKLDLGKINWVVFDEADEMLSMGFKDELDFILEQTPDEKQTLLFSATMPKEIARIAKKYMRDAAEITAGAKNTGAKNVTHVYYSVSHRNRYNALKRIADLNPNIYGIVFCRTRRETKEVAERLIQEGYNADALHGDLSQAQRDVVMARFRKKHLQLLIATDVAARGIDVDDLSHVINYMLPDQMESYIHRSGRTGRAGKAGVSIAIVTPREQRKIRTLEKQVGKTFEKGKIPTGREICEVRLFHVIDELRQVDVDEENIAEFMPAIYERLEDLDKEQLVKQIVSLEFNRLVAYYKNAPNIDAREKGKDDDGEGRKKRRNEVEFSRFHINVGSKQNLTPQRLMGVINDHPAISKVTIGQIEIFKKFSFFDVDSEYAEAVAQALAGTEFEEVQIAVEPVKSPQRPSGSDKKRDARGKKHRSPNSNRARRSRERDRDKFKKKPRRRF